MVFFNLLIKKQSGQERGRWSSLSLERAHLSLREFRSISLALGINWCLLGKSKVDWPSRKCAASRSCRESSSDITARLLVRFSSFLRSCVDCAEWES